MDWKDKANKYLGMYSQELWDAHVIDSESPFEGDDYVGFNSTYCLDNGCGVHIEVTIDKTDIEEMENETMEKNYITLNENFGYMPLPGYISKLNQTICTKDGWDVIAFLKKLDAATQQLTDASEHRDWEEQEAFIILSYDDSSMELQYEILFDLANSEKKFDYDTHYYRIYTKDEYWGLDEIEPLKEKEEYELVKVKVYRDCVVRECAELYISVKKEFGEDAKEEAEHYVENSYCGNIEWERESEYDYEEEGDIQIDESWIEDTGIKEEIEYSYDIDDTLE